MKILQMFQVVYFRFGMENKFTIKPMMMLMMAKTQKAHSKHHKEAKKDFMQSEANLGEKLG